MPFKLAFIGLGEEPRRLATGVFRISGSVTTVSSLLDVWEGSAHVSVSDRLT